jgi:hypothetical protein
MLTILGFAYFLLLFAHERRWHAGLSVIMHDYMTLCCVAMLPIPWPPAIDVLIRWGPRALLVFDLENFQSVRTACEVPWASGEAKPYLYLLLLPLLLVGAIRLVHRLFRRHLARQYLGECALNEHHAASFATSTTNAIFLQPSSSALAFEAAAITAAAALASSTPSSLAAAAITATRQRRETLRTKYGELMRWAAITSAQATLLLFLMVQTTLLQQALQIFQCLDQAGATESVLAKAQYISCNSDQYSSLHTLGVFGFLVYGVGMIAYFGYISLQMSNHRIPDEFICPISGGVMAEPVLLSTIHGERAIDRHSLLRQLRVQRINPLTDGDVRLDASEVCEIIETQVTPDIELQSRLQLWRASAVDYEQSSAQQEGEGEGEGGDDDDGGRRDGDWVEREADGTVRQRYQQVVFTFSKERDSGISFVDASNGWIAAVFGLGRSSSAGSSSGRSSSDANNTPAKATEEAPVVSSVRGQAAILGMLPGDKLIAYNGKQIGQRKFKLRSGVSKASGKVRKRLRQMRGRATAEAHTLEAPPAGDPLVAIRKWFKRKATCCTVTVLRPVVYETRIEGELLPQWILRLCAVGRLIVDSVCCRCGRRGKKGVGGSSSSGHINHFHANGVGASVVDKVENPLQQTNHKRSTGKAGRMDSEGGGLEMVMLSANSGISDGGRSSSSSVSAASSTPDGRVTATAVNRSSGGGAEAGGILQKWWRWCHPHEDSEAAAEAELMQLECARVEWNDPTVRASLFRFLSSAEMGHSEPRANTTTADGSSSSSSGSGIKAWFRSDRVVKKWPLLSMGHRLLLVVYAVCGYPDFMLVQQLLYAALYSYARPYDQTFVERDPWARFALPFFVHSNTLLMVLGIACLDKFDPEGHDTVDGIAVGSAAGMFLVLTLLLKYALYARYVYRAHCHCRWSWYEKLPAPLRRGLSRMMEAIGASMGDGDSSNSVLASSNSNQEQRQRAVVATAFSRKLDGSGGDSYAAGISARKAALKNGGTQLDAMRAVRAAVRSDFVGGRYTSAYATAQGTGMGAAVSRQGFGQMSFEAEEQALAELKLAERGILALPPSLTAAETRDILQIEHILAASANTTSPSPPLGLPPSMIATAGGESLESWLANGTNHEVLLVKSPTKGLGLRMQGFELNSTQVMAIDGYIDNTPAEALFEAGRLCVGDVLVAVGGRNVFNIPFEEVTVYFRNVESIQIVVSRSKEALAYYKWSLINEESDEESDNEMDEQEAGAGAVAVSSPRSPVVLLSPLEQAQAAAAQILLEPGFGRRRRRREGEHEPPLPKVYEATKEAMRVARRADGTHADGRQAIEALLQAPATGLAPLVYFRSESRRAAAKRMADRALARMPETMDFTERVEYGKQSYAWFVVTHPTKMMLVVALLCALVMGCSTIHKFQLDPGFDNFVPDGYEKKTTNKDNSGGGGRRRLGDVGGPGAPSPSPPPQPQPPMTSPWREFTLYYHNFQNLLTPEVLADLDRTDRLIRCMPELRPTAEMNCADVESGMPLVQDEDERGFVDHHDWSPGSSGGSDNVHGGLDVPGKDYAWTILDYYLYGHNDKGRISFDRSGSISQVLDGVNGVNRVEMVTRFLRMSQITHFTDHGLCTNLTSRTTSISYQFEDTPANRHSLARRIRALAHAKRDGHGVYGDGVLIGYTWGLFAGYDTLQSIWEDMRWAVGAFVFVFFIVWLDLGSIFVTTMGLLHILMSFGIAYVFYRNIFQVKMMNLMNFLMVSR